MYDVRTNPLNPHDASKRHFRSLKSFLRILELFKKNQYFFNDILVLHLYLIRI